MGSPLAVSMSSVADACVLTADGVLDSTTYLSLRNAIIKAALDEPRAVVVEVSALSVPASSAWAVFTSARWHVSQWPDVPVALVCDSAEGRDAARRAAITRYVPVFATLDDALAHLPELSRLGRRRTRAQLPVTTASVAAARALISDWLTAWSQSDFISAASTVTTVLMENVACHTAGDMSVLRLESTGDTITVAVEDTSSAAPARHEPDPGHRSQVNGLDFLNAVCRIWGHSPTSTGKTVWAVIGPENRL